MPLIIEAAVSTDAPECMLIRGQTRENAIPVERLHSYGITAGTWADDIESGTLLGYVARDYGALVGYCFGASESGEIVVLALLPAYEGAGLGSNLLRRVVNELHARGHKRLFLGCSSDPNVRSYGFYRRLGWQSTGQQDAHGDEVLFLETA